MKHRQKPENLWMRSTRRSCPEIFLLYNVVREESIRFLMKLAQKTKSNLVQ